MILLKTITINGKNWQVAPAIFDQLKRANDNFFRTTGKQLQITHAYRSTETQAALYKKLKAANPRAQVAPPGKSFHERGQAVDVANWKDAQRFLHAEGFRNDLENDRVHFSIGEFKGAPLKTATKPTFFVIIAAAAAALYFLTKKAKN